MNGTELMQGEYVEARMSNAKLMQVKFEAVWPDLSKISSQNNLSQQFWMYMYLKGKGKKEYSFGKISSSRWYWYENLVQIIWIKVVF